ncbi:hypothetical protein G6F66_001120 [Rhizopus arrhizus]|nr:hypothetical protein G6F66_001120 [Rhizopus arrhizus]
MKIPTYSTIVLLLLPLLLSPSAAQNDSCFSLSGSTTCAAFQDYYISLTGLATQYPFLKKVTDIKTFDAGMQSFVTSPQFYLAPLGCTNKANVASKIPYARYSMTYMCSILIQDSSYSLPCNYNQSLSPPPLCKQTCFDFMASVESLTDNTDTCPNLLQQNNNMANLNSSCEYWSGLNGTNYCVIGVANEPYNCGFEDITDACSYCRTNGTDTCCRSVHCLKVSVGVIIGITIGCLAFLGILGGLAYFFYYKKKMKDKTVKKQPFPDTCSVFGYESLAASQRVLLPSSKPPPLTIQPQPIEEFYEVKHPYPPQMGDELGLHIGDIVCVAMNFDDGWALGFNVTTGLKGVFPLVCVAPAPEELLEQLLLQQTDSSTKMQVDEKSSNNIPRRTASMIRSYDYGESDSPTSPTLNTPFFEPQQEHSVPQPEPIFHQPQQQETFEMHRKNNSISHV